jgi:hypothetical protein
MAIATLYLLGMAIHGKGQRTKLISMNRR